MAEISDYYIHQRGKKEKNKLYKRTRSRVSKYRVLILTAITRLNGGIPQSQSQLEFYHWFHQRGKKVPNMHQSKLLHHLNV